ncbi:MAG TPA: hypothetical protein VHD32_10435 [Candidatus Didemnitutus sp.]|nr:hypothetical protein [Candidatus Didemnitutus sp.]
MSMPAQTPLSENAQLAFFGEPEWTPAVLSERQAENIRNAANPSGRPNSDVLRGFLRIERGQFVTRWQVDFPAHLTEQEASLYELPFSTLGKKIGKARADNWWKNPHADPALRAALARLDRFLVTPRVEADPQWIWIDPGWLPDASLVTVARDDDFVHGVLQSHIFRSWWRAAGQAADAVAKLMSFPFPWPVKTAYGTLTGIQQDLRFEVARAVRNGDQARLDEFVATAFGFPLHLDEAELLLRLQRLHKKRSGEI